MRLKVKHITRLFGSLLSIMALVIGMASILTSCGLFEVKGMEYWKLNDGGTGETVASAVRGGTAGTLKWGVWLPDDTFGRVLDFSVEGSYMKAENSKADLSGDFSISCWVMAPPREDNNRVILSQGNDRVLLYLDAADGFALTFSAEGLDGLESSGVGLVDSKWHHILVAKEENTFSYWIDGKNVKTLTVSGSVAADSSTVTLGSNASGKDDFDGSIAEVKLIKGYKEPGQATSIKLKPSSNEAKKPRLEMKKGIVIDRPQYYQNLTPYTLTEKSDIVNCMNFGFDHVKIQLVPEWMMNADGTLIKENMAYISQVVQMVLDLDYRVLICVSPCATSFGAEFKTKYLGVLKNFEILCKWYGELGQYIAEQKWSPDHVALQLMTEPYGNNDSVSWSWMSDRMYAAVRNVLPDHTLVTSTDHTGNIEWIKKMSPATDSNLIYSFTTYDPVTPGWSNAYSSQIGKNDDFWNYIGNVPYPIEEGVDYTSAIEECIRLVPKEMKAEARYALTQYVQGKMDAGDMNRNNLYDSLYNANWHMLRAKSLDDWRQKYGGNIHLMVVEFGVFDGEFTQVRFNAVGPGVSDKTRRQLIKDMRLAWEAYDIGWTYWDYNEGFTVFDPTYHMQQPYSSPSEELAKAVVDYTLLTDSLGLTPKVRFEVPDTLQDAKGAWQLSGDSFDNGAAMKSALPGIGTDGAWFQVTAEKDAVFGSVPKFTGNSYGVVQNPSVRLSDAFTISAQVKTTSKGSVILSCGEESLVQTENGYGKFMIKDFDSYGGVSCVTENHVGLSTENPAQGTGCYALTSTTGEDIWVDFRIPYMDLSALLSRENKASMHISLFTEDASAVKGGTLILITSGGEIRITLQTAALQNGWTDLIIDPSSIRTGRADLTQVKDARIVFQMHKPGTIKVDDWYLFYPEPMNATVYWRLMTDENGALLLSADGMDIPSSGANIADDQWHHLMVSCSDGTLIYYVDGKPVKSALVSGALKSTSSNDLVIGADISGRNGISGSLSHVALYQTAKTPGGVWKK